MDPHTFFLVAAGYLLLAGAVASRPRMRKYGATVVAIAVGLLWGALPSIEANVTICGAWYNLIRGCISATDTNYGSPHTLHGKMARRRPRTSPSLS